MLGTRVSGQTSVCKVWRLHQDKGVGSSGGKFENGPPSAKQDPLDAPDVLCFNRGN